MFKFLTALFNKSDYQTKFENAAKQIQSLETQLTQAQEKITQITAENTKKDEWINRLQITIKKQQDDISKLKKSHFTKKKKGVKNDFRTRIARKEPL